MPLAAAAAGRPLLASERTARLPVRHRISVKAVVVAVRHVIS